MHRWIRVRAVLVLGVGLLATAGCSRKSDQPAHRTIVGEAETIDVASGQVSMRWYNENKQTTVRVSGTVTDQTEILINGRVAGLGDIQTGEKVKVTGRIVKDSGSAQLVATRIEIERDRPAASSRPATAAPKPEPGAPGS